MHTPRKQPLMIAAAAGGLIICLGFFCLTLTPQDAMLFLSLGLGMAVTSDQLITRSERGRAGYPIAASTILYGGTLVFVNAAGYAAADTAAGVNKFAGIAVRRADNSGGAAGDLKADVWTDGTHTLTGSGFSQATVGAKIYASDNYTATATATANVLIGVCREYISATKIRVEINAVPAP